MITTQDKMTFFEKLIEAKGCITVDEIRKYMTDSTERELIIFSIGYVCSALKRIQYSKSSQKDMNELLHVGKKFSLLKRKMIHEFKRCNNKITTIDSPKQTTYSTIINYLLRFILEYDVNKDQLSDDEYSSLMVGIVTFYSNPKKYSNI